MRSVRSVASSRMSGATNLSRPSTAHPKQSKPFDDDDDETMSIHTRPDIRSQYSELDEDDEWTAIQNFNTMLHYEEQKQTLARDKERKRLLSLELSK